VESFSVMGDDEEEVRALEQLYRSRYPRFFRLALAVLGNREAAADAVQEAFVRALRKRRRLRHPDALEPWVWRTVLNVSLSQRTSRLRAPALAPAPEAAANGHPEEWPELRAALAALPERQRSVLFLRHYADLDYERIGEVLGIARGTVAATLTQAHAALRKTMEVPR
jgi:RNA polymerase sigma-70 factor (ECF subfamily)